MAIGRIITTEWFERHPHALTTDTNGRKKARPQAAEMPNEETRFGDLLLLPMLMEYLLADNTLTTPAQCSFVSEMAIYRRTDWSVLPQVSASMSASMSASIDSLWLWT
jgi:hypothetical protein